MVNSTIDRRLLRTKRNLQEAMLTLLEKKSVNEISIRELSELADINRGTFYLHYHDPYELFREMTSDFLAQATVAAGIPQDSSTITDEDAIATLSRIYTFFQDNHRFVRILLGPNGDLFFQRSLENLVHTALASHIAHHRSLTSDHSLKYIEAVLVSGITATIITWLDSGMEESPQEMAEISFNLITGNTNIFSF